MEEETRADTFEVVYYSHPVPEDAGILTFLGLIFDRIHFPNVYIPTDGFDPDKVLAEYRRIETLEQKSRDTWQTLMMLQYALNPAVQEYCYFTGKSDEVFGGELDAAKDLVPALYEQIHGPNPEGWRPIITTGYSKSLSDDEWLGHPGDYYYQCNALLYSGKRGIPLLNTNPAFPVPSLMGEDAKNNARLLSAIMAIQCVAVALPQMGALQPEQISQARSELAPHIDAFKAGILRLARELNSAIAADDEKEDIIASARFLAETHVLPALLELKNELEKPKQDFLTRSWDLTKKMPKLITQYATGSPELVPSLLEALGDWLNASRKNQPRSDMYYLLILEDLLRK